MKTNGSARSVFNLILLASCTALPACVQPRTTNASPHQEVAELGKQVESLTKYAAQMEKLYAAQEAEILALRQEVASLASQNSGSD